ncbi:hypothetical protein ACRYCC_15530 [Actinomadura scrupuli]|uniref:hypothetical protein n=1 Tax=Actinomadura scrupuli TaxID=559629 RepID=UPI003D954F52
MRKKIIVVGVLAGGAALAGLAGSAYAEGGTVPGPGKAHGPDGKPVAVSCIGTGVPGKGMPAKAVPGKAVPGKGGEPALKVKTGAKGTGVKLPPRGKTLFKTGDGGKALPAPPPGTKLLPGGPVKILKDGKGTLKIKAPKGVRCSAGHPGGPGVPPPPNGKPPVSTRPAPTG